MKEKGPYSRRDLIIAVNMSAILGWMGIVLPSIFEMNAGLLGLVALFGLPVAFAISWVVVAPILRRIMCNPISWSRASIWGALIAAIIAAITIVIGRLRGLSVSKNPNFNFQLGGGEFVREVDGILTLYGWQLLARNTLMFIGVGIVVALIVRAAIGGGQSNGADDAR